jgi:hypothetical protein
MKPWIVSAIAALMLLAGSELCVAQGNMIVQLDGVLKSRSMSGTIWVKANQSPISEVTIEDCAPSWKDVIFSSVSDSNGRFVLQSSKAKIHYLRLISPGFNITLVKIQMTRWSWHKSLRLEMTVGT